MGGFDDLAGHCAIARNQGRDHRFAERPVREHRFNKDCARHFRQRRLTDRKDARRAGRVFESAQFAKERTRFDISGNEVLPGVVERRPEAAGHDEIDVSIVGPLTDPGARRRLEPTATPIENPAGLGIERLETGVRRKRVYGHHRIRR